LSLTQRLGKITVFGRALVIKEHLPLPLKVEDRFMVEATLFRGSKETWLWNEGLAIATVQRHQSQLPLS